MAHLSIHEVQSACIDLAKLIGPNADVFASINTHDPQKSAAYVTIYPQGICKGTSSPLYIYGDEWAEILAAARAKWAEHSSEHDRQTIRKMALEIIRITAELGDCTDAALRAAFAPGEVERYGEQAVADANMIASNGPFSITIMRGANSADGSPDEEPDAINAVPVPAMGDA